LGARERDKGKKKTGKRIRKVLFWNVVGGGGEAIKIKISGNI